MKKNPTYDELYAQVRGLERRSDLFRTIQQINRLITKEKDRNRLLSNACELLVGTRGYYNAFIVLLENGRPVSPWFHDGFDGNFEPMAALLEAGHLPDCAGRTLEQEGPRVVVDPADQCRSCPFAETYAGRAGMSMRLEHNRRLFGWLSVSIPLDLIAQQDEKDLFCEVCADISFALWSLQTEAQRDALAKKYAVVLQATSNAVISVDTEGMITLFNLGAEKLLACCADEALSTPVFRFFPEHKQAEQKERLTRVIAQGATLTFEAQCSSREGRQIPVELTVDTIVDEDGHAVGATCIFHDITERKTAEQILFKSEEKYRALYDNAPLSYQSLDDDGRFLDVNPTWLKTLLLVEDEPTILMMTAKMLERLGYTVLKAGKPADAIQTAHAHRGHLHLLLSDIVMPEMNGRELSEKIQAIHPGLKVLFMSGYTANVIADRGVLYKGVHFIQKPFSKNDLALKVRAVLDNGASR